MTDKQQVRVLYTDFLVRHVDAQDEPVNQRRRFLARWMTEPGITEMMRGLAEQDRNHQRTRGHYAPHVMTVTIDESSATVNDCVDQSGIDLHDARTGKSVTGDQPDRFWGVTNLKKTDNGWRVSRVGYKDKTCEG